MQPLLIHAIYENGVLRPEQPLPLAVHERVQVSIQTIAKQQASASTSMSRARATSGLLGWTGDAATLERLALDPDFGIEESP